MTTPNTPCANPAPFGIADRGHPNYQANEDASLLKSKGCVDCICCYCGKYVKSPKRYAYLTACAEWTIIEECCDTDFMGFYPLGSDCAAKLKKVGVPVYKSNTRFGTPGFKATLMRFPKGVTPLITTKADRLAAF